MFPIEDKFINICLFVGLCTYVALGLASTFLISDDFDEIRLTLTVFTGLPAMTIFCLLSWWTYGRWVRYTATYYALLFVIFVSFAPGLFSFFNAVSGDTMAVKQSVGYSQRSFIESKKRGGFGFLYKYRF